VVDVVDEPEPVIPELAITEYVEGSSNNKAVEVSYVGTNLTAIVHDCQLELYSNGNSEAGAKISLGLLMAPDDPLVICHSRSTAALLERCDVEDASLSFNGNDALVIRCGDTVVDAFGQVGKTPENGVWGEGDVASQDKTIRRICPVKLNDLYDQPFDVAAYFAAVDDEITIDVFDDLNSFSCE
jgi:predicted extracellular nuclease